MKKGWKIFWIICAVLAAVGIFLTVAGTALGGLAMLRGDKDEGIIRAWADRLGSWAGNEITVVTDVTGLVDKNYTPGELDGIEITSYSGIDGLDLELTGMTVCVMPYNEKLKEVYNGDIIVDISQCRDDLKDQITVTQNGSELKVRMEEQRRLNTQDIGVMYISVPRDLYFEKIIADAKAGLIELSEIKAGELDVNTDAGQIIVSNFSAKRVGAECGAGQITLEGEVTELADINCNVGEVVCILPGTEDAYDYELRCDVGRLWIDGESYNGIENKKKIDNGSGCRINVECSLGNVEIDFE